MYNTNLYGHFDKARKSFEKFEKVDEIRTVEESIFGLETVKAAMKSAINTLINKVNRLQNCYDGRFFSEADIELLRDREEWDVMFRGYILYSLNEMAVKKYFDDEVAWSIKKIFIRILNEEFNEELALEYIDKMKCSWLRVFTCFKNIQDYAEMSEKIVSEATGK